AAPTTVVGTARVAEISVMIHLWPAGGAAVVREAAEETADLLRPMRGVVAAAPIVATGRGMPPGAPCTPVRMSAGVPTALSLGIRSTPVYSNSMSPSGCTGSRLP